MLKQVVVTVFSRWHILIKEQVCQPSYPKTLLDKSDSCHSVLVQDATRSKHTSYAISRPFGGPSVLYLGFGIGNYICSQYHKNRGSQHSETQQPATASIVCSMTYIILHRVLGAKYEHSMTIVCSVRDIYHLATCSIRLV